MKCLICYRENESHQKPSDSKPEPPVITEDIVYVSNRYPQHAQDKKTKN